jgi:hypothetical protein
MGTGGPFPGGKAQPGRDADHSPHLVPRSRNRSYTPLPPSAFIACSGTALALEADTVDRPGDDPRKECEECGNAR